MTARGFAVRALGVRWWVDTSALDAPTHDMLAHLWSRASAECGDAPPEATFTLVPAGAAEVPAVGHRVAELGDRIPYGLSRALTLATLQRRAGELLLLHAAGLTTPGDGRAVVLVAASGTGKSSAAHHLARTWGYLSDESIGVDADLRVVGYPKPVSLLVDPGDLSHKVETSPDDARYATAPVAPDLGAVVLLRRDPERSAAPTLTPVPLLDAMVATIAQTSSLYLLDEPLDHLARTLSAGGGPWALHYRDIDECGALLAGLLATEALATEAAWEHLPPGEDRRAVVPGELVGEPRRAEPVPALTSATRLRRGPWTDTVVLGDEALVLVADRPYRLGGVGHAIWIALADPRSVADLVGDVVDALGAHPEAADLTERGAADLLAQGLVEVAGITE